MIGFQANQGICTLTGSTVQLGVIKMVINMSMSSRTIKAKTIRVSFLIRNLRGIGALERQLVMSDYLSYLIRYQQIIYVMYEYIQKLQQITYKLANNLLAIKYMSSASKLQQSIKTKTKNNTNNKNMDMETALSAYLVGKNKSQHNTKQNKTQTHGRPHMDNNNKPKISAFELHDIPNSKTNPDNKYTKQINSIQNINQEYIQLFYELFISNSNLQTQPSSYSPPLAHTQGDIKQNLNKNQRYQLQCMKILKKISLHIDKLNSARKVNSGWGQVQDYVESLSASSTGYHKQQCFKTAIQLINKYKDIQNQLRVVEQQHKNLVSKTVQYLHKSENVDENPLSQIQKQYKQGQKKLNKIMNQEQYLTLKVENQQKILEELQDQIKKAEENKLNLQMKVISQKGRKDRLLRKKQNREKPENFSNQKKQIQQKPVRSKSSNRFTFFKD